jgi:hypothetical protein
MATIAFYGPDLSRASKVAVGIIHSEGAPADEMRSWFSDETDVRHDPSIARNIAEFIEAHGVRSVAMSAGIMGCPHQEGTDYEGEWCPVCDFWKGRDRFTGKLLIESTN